MSFFALNKFLYLIHEPGHNKFDIDINVYWVCILDII